MSTILANGKGWQWSETCVSMNDGKHRRCFNFLPNKCNQCDFPFFQAIWGNIWKTHKLEKSRTNASNDLEHVWLWRRAPSTKLQLPAKPFCLTHCRPVCPTDFYVMVPNSGSWNSCMCLWLAKQWSFEWAQKWKHRKEIHRWHFIAPGSPTKMLLLVLACLHQPAGSSHLLPHISVGPYRPWISSQHKPWGSHPQHQELHPIQQETNHPGYQTNIVIDPYAKVSIEIRGKIYDLISMTSPLIPWNICKAGFWKDFCLRKTFDIIV